MTLLDVAQAIPAGLSFDPDTDPQRGRHLALGVRWGARVAAGHELAGEVIERDMFRVDEALLATRGGLPVNVDHGPGRVGSIVDAATDDTGLWIVFDADDEGERLLSSGIRDVSVEVIMPRLTWLLSGVALITGRGNEPAVPGSRVVFSGSRVAYAADLGQLVDAADDWYGWAPHGRPWLSTLAATADRSGGAVQIGCAARPSPPPPAARPVADVARAKAFCRSMSTTAVEVEVAAARRRFADRRASLAAAERDRAEARWSMVPAHLRPAGSPLRVAYEQLLARQEAARVAAEARRAERERERVERETAAKIAAALEAEEAARWRNRIRTSWAAWTCRAASCLNSIAGRLGQAGRRVWSAVAAPNRWRSSTRSPAKSSPGRSAARRRRSNAPRVILPSRSYRRGW